MTYIKPDINLLTSPNNAEANEMDVLESCNDSIIECFCSHGISVDSAGYRASAINMIFDYSIPSGVAFKSIQNLTSEISVAVGNLAKIFPRDEVRNEFSVAVIKEKRNYIALSQILASEEFQKSNAKIAICAGIDERDRSICFDLADAPHMLISGTTGAGKTVFLDDIILSILFKSSPDDVRMVLIDPEGKDFILYDRLPHLLFPVVTDKTNAVEVVNQLNNLMASRFDQFAGKRVKNIESYNEKAQSKLPRIVVIIDKYLELTTEIPKSFEDCLNEIACKGRAAGIHLVINSQTARSEGVSNSLKANLPCRAAFSVIDWHESKAIIDRTGAQKLLGNGDMLLDVGSGSSVYHVQAPYVTEAEVKAIVAQISDANESVQRAGDLTKIEINFSGDTEYTRRILEAVSEMSTINVFLIQKKLNIGFAEASEIIKFLEENDFVSTYAADRGRIVQQDRVIEYLETINN